MEQGSPSSSEARSNRAWERGEVWCKWRAQMQGLRTALLCRSSDSQVREVITECIALYKVSHTIPSTSDGLLACISGKHTSPLEAAFMWIGGWRPTSAVTLVYSNMGIDVKKSDRGVDGSNAAQPCRLSKAQLGGMSALQDYTCRSEIDLSNRLATLQMLVADQNMVEAIGLGSSTITAEKIVQGQQLMDSKLELLRDLLDQSNRLRLYTIQELQSLLTPAQAGECIVAAFELVFAIKALGTTGARNSTDSVQEKLHQILALSPPCEAPDLCQEESKFSNAEEDKNRGIGGSDFREEEPTSHNGVEDKSRSVETASKFCATEVCVNAAAWEGLILAAEQGPKLSPEKYPSGLCAKVKVIGVVCGNPVCNHWQGYTPLMDAEERSLMSACREPSHLERVSSFPCEAVSIDPIVNEGSRKVMLSDGTPKSSPHEGGVCVPCAAGRSDPNLIEGREKVRLSNGTHFVTDTADSCKACKATSRRHVQEHVCVCKLKAKMAANNVSADQT